MAQETRASRQKPAATLDKPPRRRESAARLPGPSSADAAELPTRAQRAQIRAGLLSWYRHSHRDLPWRRLGDPYAVWISEIMLQQTRVETVKEYFRRFLARFPTPSALADGPLEEVLALWSGLGYYARARNLHAAACVIRDQHGGVFPQQPEAVHSLPGIGPYTAGAVLSIAFAQRAPIVDGNVIRVLSRLFTISEAQEEAATRRRLWALASDLVPDAGGDANDPGDFNQALMELGATVCLPKNPSCLVCPVSASCAARIEGDPERYPARKRERLVPTVDVVSLLVQRGAQVVLLQRPPAGLWGGLWEPPTGERADDEAPEAALARLCAERLCSPGLLTRGALSPLPPFEHLLTHRRMRFQPYRLALEAAPALTRLSGYQAARWVTPGEPLALGLSAWVSALLGTRAAAEAARTGTTDGRP